MVNVRADSRQNNKKATVLQFKIGNFVKFRQKSIFSPQGWFFVILSVFRQKRNPMEPRHHTSISLEAHHVVLNKLFLDALLSAAIFIYCCRTASLSLSGGNSGEIPCRDLSRATRL